MVKLIFNLRELKTLFQWVVSLVNIFVIYIEIWSNKEGNKFKILDTI